MTCPKVKLTNTFCSSVPADADLVVQGGIGLEFEVQDVHPVFNILDPDQV